MSPPKRPTELNPRLCQPSTLRANISETLLGPLEGVYGLESTCGGLYPVNVVGRHSGDRDPVTGEVLSLPFYNRFRCSSDRLTVVGTAKDLGGDLYEGVPPATKIAEVGVIDPIHFDVSPDGSKIAYIKRGDYLCVFSTSGPVQCSDGAFLVDSPSVKDSGQVLIAVGTGQSCLYKTMWNFSPQPLPGATESTDECLGIGYWRPGLKSIEIIERLGRSPQWIKPETAKLLREWAARSGTDTSK